MNQAGEGAASLEGCQELAVTEENPRTGWAAPHAAILPLELGAAGLGPKSSPAQWVW